MTDQSKNQEQKSQEQQSKQDKGKGVQRMEDIAQEDEDHPGYVEAPKPEEDDKVRAVATPESERTSPEMQGAPDEGPYVGELLNQLRKDVNPLDEQLKQQQENYPRLPANFFDPHEDNDVSETPSGAGVNTKGTFGRLVTVDEEVLFDGQVYNPGLQELPLDVADALIEAHVAWEPAGKGRGR